MRRTQFDAMVALFVAYGAFYLCRANVEAAMPALIREGYGDKTRLGTLSSVATLAYSVGKVVLGAWGDRLGGRRLMLIAVAGSVVCSFGFGLSGTLVVLGFFAAANRFFQSGGWPGLVHVVSRRFEARRHGRVMGVLSMSYELGNACALLLSGLVARWGWRALFVVNPALFALVGGGAVLSLRRTPADGDAPDTRTPPPAGSRDIGRSDHHPANEGARAREGAADAGGRAERARVLAGLLRSGALWTTVALSALLTFIRVGFLTWTPTYLAEVSRAAGNADISSSIIKSAVFPAAGAVAVLSTGPLSDRFGAGRRAPIIALSLGVVVVLVELLAHTRALPPAWLIGAIGLFLLGPYSLLAGAMALDVGGARGSATAAGIIDGAGYLSGTAAPFLLGYVADRAGWAAAFDVVGCAALLATAIASAWSLSLARRGRAPSPAPAVGGGDP